jgi:NADH-ubiquinone oxidoreductase chain 5
MFGSQTTKYLDRGIIEQLGPYGLEKVFIYLSHIISNLNTGVVTTYALYILVGFIVYILTPSLNILDSNSLLLILIALLTTININNSSSSIKTI